MIFTGNLGADSVVKDVKDQKVINFSVASTQTYTDSSGEKKENTTWIDWGRFTKRKNLTRRQRI